MAFNHPLVFADPALNAQIAHFPSSRFMGSKNAILPFLHETFRELEFTTVLDAFNGSGAVGYLLKSMGKAVTSNDLLHFSYHTAQACIANNGTHLPDEGVQSLLVANDLAEDFIQTTFQGLYFTDAENCWLDNVTANIRGMSNSIQQSIAYAALSRACLRRRPRGLFTYTGTRYLDGRRDIRTSLEEHFYDAVRLFNTAVFENGQPCRAFQGDVFALPDDDEYDLVYFDPPYVSSLSDNDYARRYHFVEGLTRYWEGLEIQQNTTTKKFRRIPSAFDTKRTIHAAFERLFTRYQNSIIVVSYSSNSIPTRDDLTELLQCYKRNVRVFEKNHRYSSGTHAHKVHDNQNVVQEFLFVGC